MATNNSLSVEISLDAEAGNLDEVVLVGYGKQRKISQIGSQSTLNIEELRQHVANVTAELVGRLAGLITVQGTGEPGHDAADRCIRGIAQLNNSKTLSLLVWPSR